MVGIDNSLASLTAFEPKKLDKNVNDAKLKEQTDNFEAFMVKKILDISLKRENSIFGKDAGDKIYNSMYNDTMSKAISGGLGYSELLYNFLKDNQTN
jgi:Rod binding domain-containing protein